MSESKFKVGDEVYSLTKGKGIVTSVSTSEVKVKFGEDCFDFTYQLDGKYYNVDLIPEIYHTKPEITIPKRMVEKKQVRWLIQERLEQGDYGFTEEEFKAEDFEYERSDFIKVIITYEIEEID